jgi:hypothetical protein
MNAWRSVTHGTCALNGQHTDPKLRAECPVLRSQNRAQRPYTPRRASRFEGAAQSGGARQSVEVRADAP